MFGGNNKAAFVRGSASLPPQNLCPGEDAQGRFQFSHGKSADGSYAPDQPDQEEGVADRQDVNAGEWVQSLAPFPGLHKPKVAKSGNFLGSPEERAH